MTWTIVKSNNRKVKCVIKNKSSKTKKTSPQSLVPGMLMLMQASWSETISKQRNSPLPLISPSLLAQKLTYQSSNASLLAK